MKTRLVQCDHAGECPDPCPHAEPHVPVCCLCWRPVTECDCGGDRRCSTSWDWCWPYGGDGWRVSCVPVAEPEPEEASE